MLARVLGLFGQSPAGQAPTRGLGLPVVTKRRNADESGQPYGQGEEAIEFDLLLVVQFADFDADFLGTYGDDPVCLNLGRFFKPVRDLGFDGKAQ